VNRRRLITLLGGAAAAWPLAARAQQKPMPVIGFFGPFPAHFRAQIELELAAFRDGLRETGYVEGQNVVIEYRRADGDYGRLPALAADLVSRKVDVIVTQGSEVSTFAAKNATSTIPIVFHSSGDPVAFGLVSSLARPDGNLTGVAYLGVELMPKLLELLLELVPQGKKIALLVQPDRPEMANILEAMQAAARARRVDLIPLKARVESDVDGAFATLVQMRADGLVLESGGLRRRVAELALRHRVPAITAPRDFASDGGLISYGPSITALYRLKGIYAGKILKGAKPADLPVQQPTKFELVINLKTAKALGLTVPPSLFARADEVIE
jgi:putative tryptophan/tyrosine transport system substrate-binding protein